MNTNRLNSFTDGVIAVIITIMVLELPVPKAPGMAALEPLTVLFVVYALSFIKVGIYWSQHHNMLQAAKKVSGPVLLANLFFLFWLSLIPFVVRWVGEAGITKVAGGDIDGDVDSATDRTPGDQLPKRLSRHPLGKRMDESRLLNGRQECVRHKQFLAHSPPDESLHRDDSPVIQRGLRLVVQL